MMTKQSQKPSLLFLLSSLVALCGSTVLMWFVKAGSSLDVNIGPGVVQVPEHSVASIGS